MEPLERLSKEDESRIRENLRVCPVGILWREPRRRMYSIYKTDCQKLLTEITAIRSEIGEYCEVLNRLAKILGGAH